MQAPHKHTLTRREGRADRDPPTPPAPGHAHTPHAGSLHPPGLVKTSGRNPPPASRRTEARAERPRPAGRQLGRPRGRDHFPPDRDIPLTSGGGGVTSLALPPGTLWAHPESPCSREAPGRPQCGALTPWVYCEACPGRHLLRTPTAPCVRVSSGNCKLHLTLKKSTRSI